jgi:hypothetical protein
MNVMRLLGLAAVGGLLMLAAPAERARRCRWPIPAPPRRFSKVPRWRPPRSIGRGIVITIIIGATTIAITGTITIIVTTADGVGAARSQGDRWRSAIALKQTGARWAPVSHVCRGNRAAEKCSRAQLQFLNFQDLSFHGVSVSTRHCTHRSGGQ